MSNIIDINNESYFSDKIVNFLVNISVDLNCVNDFDVLDLRKFLKKIINCYKDEELNITSFDEDMDEFMLNEFNRLYKAEISIYTLDDFVQYFDDFYTKKYKNTENSKVIQFINKADFISDMIMLFDDFSLDMCECYNIQRYINDNELIRCFSTYFDLYLNEFNLDLLKEDFIDGMCITSVLISESDIGFMDINMVDKFMIDRYNYSDKSKFDNGGNCKILKFKFKEGEKNGDSCRK